MHHRVVARIDMMLTTVIIFAVTPLLIVVAIKNMMPYTTFATLLLVLALPSTPLLRIAQIRIRIVTVRGIGVCISVYATIGGTTRKTLVVVATQYLTILVIRIVVKLMSIKYRSKVATVTDDSNTTYK